MDEIKPITKSKEEFECRGMSKLIALFAGFELLGI